ncbi:MAG TPA: DUF1653 domain-containing protein [Lachnospiraceae bacterium]|nr:DUF1653 domain-containing protein [Lachnospiraceae bacterium]HIS60879.1 DUF1653 domain-containing protein [Candidatus Scybalomonas excrementigallinarum]
MSEKRELYIGDFVTHFKRELLTKEELEKEPTKYFYRIEGFATHSETREKMVVYRALYGDFGLFVRPFAMFQSEVDKEKYPQVKAKYRFTVTKHETA